MVIGVLSGRLGQRMNKALIWLYPKGKGSLNFYIDQDDFVVEVELEGTDKRVNLEFYPSKEELRVI